MRESLVRRLLEEQDTVFRCHYAAKWGNNGGRGGQENVGTKGDETAFSISLGKANVVLFFFVVFLKDFLMPGRA